DRGMKHGKAEIARLEIKVLLVPEVNLSERPDMSGGPDQDSAVEELVAIALANAGDDVQLVFCRNLAPRLDCSPAGNALRDGEGFLARLEHVAGVGKLRQHDKLRAEPSGAIDQCEAVLNVGFDLSDHRLHLNAGNPDLGFIRHLRVERIHRTPLLYIAQNK